MRSRVSRWVFIVVAWLVGMGALWVALNATELFSGFTSLR